MSDSFETVVKNFSGLSSETKPTIAAGNAVPNGSRWREVDSTGKVTKIFHFNLADDKWYESGEHLKSISSAGPVVDIRALELFEQMLTTLKKIEYHLYLASDTELKDQDVT